MAYQPLKSLATLNATLQISKASAERIFEIIDQEPSIIERNPNKDSSLKANNSYNLKIEKVDFKYESSSNLILRNINIEISKGQKVALVGHSGAGKTSLLNLIPRFFDVERGHIFLGGIDIRDLSFKFRKMI